jgi:Skp family chaperone for outer membrane proteins
MRILFTILTFSLLLASVAGQNSYGYYDSDKIFENLPDYAQFNDSIKIRRQQIKDTVELLLKEFNNYRFFPINSANPDCTKINKMIKAEKDDFYNRIINYKSSFNQRLDKEEQDKKTELYDIYSDFVKSFFKKNDLIIIADKKAVLYCKDCIDYTNDLIEFIKNK